MFNTLRISEPRGRYVETYQLDLHDRVTSVTNIEGQAMDIEYYVGDMVSKTTRFDGSVVSNAYDSVGRLASSRISNSEHGTPNIEVNYTYWPDGEIKTVSDGISTIANSYDRLNRVAGVTNQTAGITAVVNHQYDGVNLTNTSVSVGGSSSTSTAYEYDAAERLEVLTTENTEYTEQFVYGYNSENGKIASVSNTVPGLVCEYEYDLLDRATNIVYTLGTNLIRSLDYEFDDVSMIEKKTIHGRGEAVASLRVTSTSYAYDSLDRLVAEKRTGGTSSTSSYTYDLEATASPKPPMASKPHTHWELEIALHQAPPPQTPRSSFKARPTN